MVDCAINGFIGDQISLSKGMLWALKTEQNELKPLKNINTTLFDAILCLFCGFEARTGGLPRGEFGP